MQGCTRRHALGIGLVALVWFSGCGKDDSDAAQAPNVPTAEPLPVAAAGSLTLNLKVGDRFPLLKTVTQELRQASAIGPALSQTRLELLLTISVDEVKDDRKLLSVKYTRVRYTQDVAGEKFDVDSSRPVDEPPLAALPYLGLVDNGFSFWVGRDNQIIEPVGFPAFLERCVRNVPEEDRRGVLRQFALATADEGVANFVDDSIGLLPYDVEGKSDGSSVAEGDTWVRDRRLMQPVPLYLKNRYTLRSLTRQIAEIDVLGTVTPSVTPKEGSIVPAADEVDPQARKATTPDVIVRGGNSYGTCTIDRATGLPLKSKVERYLDMSVRLPNGLAFEQRKRTETTIESFPQQSPQTGAAPSGTATVPPKPLATGGAPAKRLGAAGAKTEPARK